MLKKFDIMTFGVPMVEFTRVQKDIPLSKPGDFYGPVPAGDPGIVISACARLGYKGCYVGVIGRDAFADCFLDSMRKNNIDVSHIRVDPLHDTGLSMLTKFSDGSRDFLFTVPHSAAAKINPTQDLDLELLRSVRCIHVSGFAISISNSSAALHRQMLEQVGDDVLVSFDPNYRQQVICLEDYLPRARQALERCNFFLPSRGEAEIFSVNGERDEDVCARVSRQGKRVVLKDGKRGAVLFDSGEAIFIPAFDVEEIDSTGAGDTFDGAFIAASMAGKNPIEAATYASAAAAWSVTRTGLMDTPTREDVDEMLRCGHQKKET